MGPSQLYAATLTHSSTEPLTTAPVYDPLLLLLALAGDVHPNPGPSRYPCSVCFKNVTSQGTSYLCTRCSHLVHSRCSGLRNAANYRKANGWICTACMTPPQPHVLSPPPSPAQFSRCIISIILSHHLVRMANTHDHEPRSSAHPHRITDNCHLISCPAQNLHQPQKR